MRSRRNGCAGVSRNEAIFLSQRPSHMNICTRDCSRYLKLHCGSLERRIRVPRSGCGSRQVRRTDTTRGTPTFCRCAANCPDYLFGAKRLEQNIVPALVQNLHPQVFVCIPRSHDKVRRLEVAGQRLPDSTPSPIREFSIADNRMRVPVLCQQNGLLTACRPVNGPTTRCDNLFERLAVFLCGGHNHQTGGIDCWLRHVRRKALIRRRASF